MSTFQKGKWKRYPYTESFGDGGRGKCVAQIDENVMLLAGAKVSYDGQMAYKYNFTEDTWTQLKDLPESKEYISCAGFTAANGKRKILIQGGRENSNGDALSKTGFIYDADTDTYEDSPDAPFLSGGLGVVPAKYLPLDQASDGDRVFHFSGQSLDEEFSIKTHEYHYGEAEPWSALPYVSIDECQLLTAIPYNLYE